MLSQPAGSVQTPKHRNSRPTETPIYLPDRTRPIGRVVGNVFVKSVRGSKHLLKRPPAICFDLCTVDDAEAAGATLVRVHDIETGAVFEASISTLRAKGFKFNRGWGEQIALPLERWQRPDFGAASEQPKSLEQHPAAPVQASLFGEG